MTALAIYDYFEDLDDVRRVVIDYVFVEFVVFLVRRVGNYLALAERLDALCHVYVEFRYHAM